METDTDKCGPLYCPGCGWQSAPCEHDQDVPTNNWVIWADSGEIEMYCGSEADVRETYKQVIAENPIVADFIHLSRLVIDTRAHKENQS